MLSHVWFYFLQDILFAAVAHIINSGQGLNQVYSSWTFSL